MVAWNETSELRDAAFGRQISLATLAERERKVRRDFWAKLKRFAGKVPFVEELVAAHITPTHRAAAARALDKELPAR